MPDYGLEDLFGDQVLPQNDKQLVPKPPSYEDVLKDLASGEKQMYIDPAFMYEPEDLPPGYEEEEEGPNYNILEHEKLNPQKKFAPGDYFEVINSVNYFAQLGELNDVCGQHQSTLYNLNELNKC